MATLTAPMVAQDASARVGSAASPRISVILPTKNERHNLPRFLASLPPEVELVLCDASDDGTPDLAVALRPRNTVVLAAPGSIAAARQAGAEASSGDVLVFTDADVELDAGYFERLRAVMDPATPKRLGGKGSDLTRDAICGPKLSRDAYARYYRLVASAQAVTYGALGIVGASGSNMVVGRAAFESLGGFRLDLRCNEDTELFLRASRRGLRVHFDPELVVWATDHRRLRRGLVWKSTHSLVRNVLLFLVCKRPGLPRLLVHDWGYWSTPRSPEPRHASGFDSV